MAYKGQPRAGGGTEIKPGIGRGEAQVFQPVQAPQQDTASIQRAYADKAAREERLAKEEADAEKERKNKLLDVEYEGLPRGSKLPLFDMYNEYRNFMINEEWDEGSDKKQMVIEENIKVTMAALKDGQEEMKGIAKNMDAGKIYENEELFYEMQTQGYYEELFKLPMEEALNKYGEDVILAKQVKPVPKDLGVIALAKQAVGGVGRSKKQTDISAEEQYDNNAALQKAYSLIEWQGVVWNQRNIAKDPKPTKPTKPTTGIGYSAGGYFYNPKIVTIKGKTYEKAESEEGEEGAYTPRPEKDREVVDYLA